MTEAPKKLRGFAAIKAKDPERHKEMCRKGGANVKPEDRPFSRDRDLASRSARKSHEKGDGDDG